MTLVKKYVVVTPPPRPKDNDEDPPLNIAGEGEGVGAADLDAFELLFVGEFAVASAAIPSSPPSSPPPAPPPRILTGVGVAAAAVGVVAFADVGSGTSASVLVFWRVSTVVATAASSVSELADADAASDSELADGDAAPSSFDATVDVNVEIKTAGARVDSDFVAVVVVVGPSVAIEPDDGGALLGLPPPRELYKSARKFPVVPSGSR